MLTLELHFERSREEAGRKPGGSVSILKRAHGARIFKRAVGRADAHAARARQSVISG